MHAGSGRATDAAKTRLHGLERRRATSRSRPFSARRTSAAKHRARRPGAAFAAANDSGRRAGDAVPRMFGRVKMVGGSASKLFDFRDGPLVD